MRDQDRRGEKAALYAGIGAAAGTMLGVILSGSLGIPFIAILGVIGAVIGMFVGFAVERRRG